MPSGTVKKVGDYKRLAFLSYGSFELELSKDCPEELKAEIIADAALIQARRGEVFQISTSGQTITLGHSPKGRILSISSVDARLDATR